MATHSIHITADQEDLTDPFSRVGDTHTWLCTCGVIQTGDPLAFSSAAIHLRVMRQVARAPLGYRKR